MNIAMEQTEEYQNGQKRATFGDAFIRGNNGMLFVDQLTQKVLYISTQPTKKK